jgi:endonuclease YncB( thermonuclease family)
MKKTLLSIMVTTLLLISALSPVSAQPGRTDANGGHTCRTNCEKWGLEYGEYHYHNGGSSSNGSSTKKPAAAKPKPAPKQTAKPQQKPAPKPNTKPKPAPAYVVENIKLEFNGEPVIFTKSPLNIQGLTFVSLSDIVPYFGKLTWNESTKTATVETSTHLLTIRAGSTTVTAADVEDETLIKNYNLKAAPQIINGKLMIPLQGLADIIDGFLSIDYETKVINLVYLDGESVGAGVEINAEAVITQIIDEKTMKALIDGKEKTLVLVDVEIPDSMKQNAINLETQKLLNKKVQLEYAFTKTDKDGNLRVSIWKRGSSINLDLVENGYARVNIVDNTKAPIGLLTEYEAAAKKDKKGMWSD